MALYKTKTYFKNKFLREEIEAICDIETFNGDEDKSAIFQFGYEENKRFDYITGPANTNMIKNLGIGGNGWERCQINDDFSGKYLGTRFRFLNTLLKKEIENQKNTKHETIFQGQVFIFQTNLNIKRPIQYNYCIENPCHKHSDFKNAFASSYFDNDILNPEYSTNPFLKTPSKFDRLRTTQRYARENRPEFETLETPDFVDNMLRLGQIIPDELWGVRFEGDKFILIISRYRNFFELNKMNPKTSLANLDKDMQELVNILSTVSQMDFIEKE